MRMPRRARASGVELQTNRISTSRNPVRITSRYCDETLWVAAQRDACLHVCVCVCVCILELAAVSCGDA